MSQETIDFVEDIVKTILSRWDNIPIDMKDKMRDSREIQEIQENLLSINFISIQVKNNCKLYK